MKRTTLMLAVAAVVAAGCSSEPAELAGIVRTPLPDVSQVALPAVADGEEPFTMRAEPGGLLLVYFGFTSCPDVCPTTLSDVRSALAELGDDASRVQVAMATVDPMRDTPDVMTGYLRSFVPDGIPLRTEDDTVLRSAATAFGASYTVTTGDDGGIEVAHTGHLYAVDDQGLLQITWPFGVTDEDIASDLEILLSG